MLLAQGHPYPLPLVTHEGAAKRINLGTSTLAQESILHDGRAWEVKHTQRVKEQNARRRDGLE